MSHKFESFDINDIHRREKKNDAAVAYADSKLANILFTKELADRLKDTNITTYCLHPGLVKTDVFRQWEHKLGPFKHLVWLLLGFFFKSAQQGGQTSVYCAVDEACASQTGLYYSDCDVKTPSEKAQDKELAQQLWKVSEREVNL